MRHIEMNFRRPSRQAWFAARAVSKLQQSGLDFHVTCQQRAQRTATDDEAMAMLIETELLGAVLFLAREPGDQHGDFFRRRIERHGPDVDLVVGQRRPRGRHQPANFQTRHKEWAAARHRPPPGRPKPARHRLGRD